MIPDHLTRANRVEARSISTHTKAHQWLTSLGARCECELDCYGKNGESFRLFAWTRKDFEHVRVIGTESTASASTASGKDG